MNTMWAVKAARTPPQAAFTEVLRTESLLVLRQHLGLGLPVCCW